MTAADVTLTDSHCHLASHQFSDDLPAVLERARLAGVHRIVSLATCKDDIAANLELAATHPTTISACVGIHPCNATDGKPDDLLAAVQAAANNPRVCAIGETGLDYYHPAPENWSPEDYHKRQRELLEAHFEIAADAGLNIVLHTRDRKGSASLEDAMAIASRHSSRTRALFHCFPGPLAAIDPLMSKGAIISFGGVATFKNAGECSAAAQQAPAGQFLLETDAPYLAPVPHRGQRNEPAFVRHTAEHIAALRGQSLESLAAETEQCANAFFRFPPPISAPI